MADVQLETGDVEHLNAVERLRGDINNVVQFALPALTEEDSAALRARLLEIDRVAASKELKAHIIGLLTSGRPTAGVAVILGRPDALPREFAERFLRHDIQELPLSERTGKFFQDWQDLAQLTRAILTWLDYKEGIRSYATPKPEELLSKFIRSRRLSVWVGFEVEADKLQASAEQLDAWLRYFAKDCPSPRLAPHLMMVFLCVKTPDADRSLKTWVEARVGELNATSSVRVVELPHVPRDEVQSWLEAYNATLIGTPRPRFPENTVATVFGETAFLDHEELCVRLQRILREQELAAAEDLARRRFVTIIGAKNGYA